MKKRNNVQIIMTIIITALITFSITSLYIYGKAKKQKDGETIIGSAIESDEVSTKLKLIKEKIQANFMGDIDEEKLKEYSIKGYVAGLDDEYSQYFTKEEMKKYTENTLGNYVGIGVYMVKNTEKHAVEVHKVMKNSPAEEVGMKKGDLITKVDERNITDEDFEKVSDWIEGKEGTQVNVVVTRENNEISYNITRKKIMVPNVESQMFENNIGYIYISSFDGDTSKEFKTEYDKLVNQGMNALILDLRNNGGGIANEAVEIGDFFTEKGQKLLIQSDKNGKEEISYSKNNAEITMKTVVLVNGYSASASEILAGICKELVDNATLVGTKTYGKGVIQSLYSLTDGSGLKLTTDKYFTPNHNDIHKKGIEPDIQTEEYKFTEELDKENDLQLKKAIEVLTQ